MIVQHNITAMNANRMLGMTTNSLSKSTEKLSSGYRINCAADDAAGLTISEDEKADPWFGSGFYKRRRWCICSTDC